MGVSFGCASRPWVGLSEAGGWSSTKGPASGVERLHRECFWSAISFGEKNGSPGVKVGAVTGYAASPTSGTVTVSAAGVTETITFTGPPSATYPFTFSETGLTEGASWSMTLSGATPTSTGSSIAFRWPNRMSGHAVGRVTGYASAPSSGSTLVGGEAVDQGITFTESGGGDGPGGGSSGGSLGLRGATVYSVLAGLVVGVAVIIPIALLLARDRQPRHAPSPAPPRGRPPGQDPEDLRRRRHLPPRPALQLLPSAQRIPPLRHQPLDRRTSDACCHPRAGSPTTVVPVVRPTVHGGGAVLSHVRTISMRSRLGLRSGTAVVQRGVEGRRKAIHPRT